MNTTPNPIHVPSVNHLAVKTRQSIHPAVPKPSLPKPSLPKHAAPQQAPRCPQPPTFTLYRNTDPTGLDSPLTSHVADRCHPPPSRTEREEVRPSVSTVPSRVGLGTPRVRDHASLRPRSRILTSPCLPTYLRSGLLSGGKGGICHRHPWPTLRASACPRPSSLSLNTIPAVPCCLLLVVFVLYALASRPASRAQGFSYPSQPPSPVPILKHFKLRPTKPYEIRSRERKMGGIAGVAQRNASRNK